MSKLGLTAKDKITGFNGVAIGYVQYISGCNQFLLVPKVKKDGSYTESHWFDEQRLVFDSKTKPIQLDNGNTPGSDKAAPTK